MIRITSHKDMGQHRHHSLHLGQAESSITIDIMSGITARINDGSMEDQKRRLATVPLHH